jgi:hypothetical protein
MLTPATAHGTAYTATSGDPSPISFVHAGDLDPRSASEDPRRLDFREREVDIDLQACEFIQPAAALWCGVYGLLAAKRNSSCRLLVPENLGVAIYLKSMELFRILQDSGVEVDDRGVGSGAATRLIIPIAQFTTETEVDTIASQASERLSAAGVGAANLYSVVAEVFAELAMNAVQHSQSEIGCLGLIQFYQSESGERFVCAVGGGIGIKASLETNRDLRRRATYDWTAIEMALEEGISGTGSNRRGIGLFGVAEDMAKPGRQLIIHSGIGLLRRTGGGARSGATRTPVRFPGTLVSASIPT